MGNSNISYENHLGRYYVPMARLANNIRQKLLRYLEDSNISQRQLAEDLKLYHSNLSKILLGKEDWNPTLDTIERISEKTKIPLEELLFPQLPPRPEQELSDTGKKIVDLKNEVEFLRQEIVALPNFPQNIVKALKKMEKKSQFELLSTLLVGMGLLNSADKIALGD